LEQALLTPFATATRERIRRKNMIFGGSGPEPVPHMISSGFPAKQFGASSAVGQIANLIRFDQILGSVRFMD